MRMAYHGENPAVFLFHCMDKLQSYSIGIRKILSIFILCKHWRLDWSEADENNYLTKGNLWKSFPHIYNFTQSKKLPVILSTFWGIFVPRQKTYQIQAGENRVNKDHCVTMQRYIEDWRMVEFGLCRRGKIWIPAAKFNEFCKRKFDKRRLLFFAVFVGCI